MDKQARRILILGGGFGGVYTARHLERLLNDHSDVEITLVSRDNYLLMTPLLFEAGSGILEPRHAVTPIRTLFRRVQFVEAEVQSIDLDRNVVLARPSADEIYELPYDCLVLALGGVTNRRLISGAEHAMSFKTLADAIFLRNYTIELFERADVERDPARKQAMLTFVIIGGGLVGVELMGEFSQFVDRLCRTYRNVHPNDIRLELLEAGPRIMPEMRQDLADYAVRLFRRRGISIRTDCPVKQIEPRRVHLPDGQVIEAETIILAAGVLPSPLVESLPLPRDHKGRIIVEPSMRCDANPRLWALGDCAAIPDPQGNPYPPLAQHALRQAKVLAGNIVASMHNRPLRPFVYQTLGTLAALGHYRGVGRIMNFRFKGFLAWWIWRTYYLAQMPRWDRRVRIMLDWTVALLFKNDVVKLDLFGEEHPLKKFEQRHLSGTQAKREIIGAE